MWLAHWDKEAKRLLLDFGKWHCQHLIHQQPNCQLHLKVLIFLLLVVFFFSLYEAVSCVVMGPWCIPFKAFPVNMKYSVLGISSFLTVVCSASFHSGRRNLKAGMWLDQEITRHLWNYPNTSSNAVFHLLHSSVVTHYHQGIV